MGYVLFKFTFLNQITGNKFLTGVCGVRNMANHRRAHEKTSEHYVACQKLVEMDRRAQIKDQFDPQRRRGYNLEVQRNRDFLKKLVSVVVLLAKTGSPFRANHKGSDSSNRGLYIETLKLLAENCEDARLKVTYYASWNLHLRIHDIIIR